MDSSDGVAGRPRETTAAAERHYSLAAYGTLRINLNQPTCSPPPPSHPLSARTILRNGRERGRKRNHELSASSSPPSLVAPLSPSAPSRASRMLTFFSSLETLSLPPAPDSVPASSSLSVFARFLRLLRSPKTHFRPVFLQRVHTASLGAAASQRDFDSRQESHAFRVLPVAERAGGRGGGAAGGGDELLWSTCSCGGDVDCATGVVEDISKGAGVLLYMRGRWGRRYEYG